MFTRIAKSAVAVALAATVAFGAAACGMGKPSKDEVKKAFTSAMDQAVSSMGVDFPDELKAKATESAKKFVNCTVDKMYDQVSADGLKAMIKASANLSDPKAFEGKLSDADQKAVTEATKACASELTPVG